MTAVMLGFIATMTQLALKYGLPAAIDIMMRWKQGDPECRDWEALRDMVPKGEEFIPKDS